MENADKNEMKKFLFSAILTLENESDCEAFFTDLCTKTEMREMSKRLWAAKLIRDGEKYTDIVESTGLSTATITRVNGCLRDGDGGYIKALEALDGRK